MVCQDILTLAFLVKKCHPVHLDPTTWPHQDDDGKKFHINKLRDSAAVEMQISSCCHKIPNDTLSRICLGHR